LAVLNGNCNFKQATLQRMYLPTAVQEKQQISNFHLDVAALSGKSSLLAALLGEMYNEGGTVKVAGTTGYAAQDPWIQNATLRDNILMGYDYDKSR
jgi:ABC-type transport system involved in cytochrome bd biosynthesis fused ATPase/permease subunit